METISVIGSDLKLNVHVEPIDGLHMESYDFECAFFVKPDRKCVIHKSMMAKKDQDNYLAPLEGKEIRSLGRGKLLMEITAYITDSDYKDGLRTEKAVTCTGVTII